MRQRWERLTFLRWPYEPALVQRLLPSGLTVHTFGGAAWVGLVPISCGCTRPAGTAHPGSPTSARPTCAPTPWTRDGRAGIWFLSLDAARAGAVAVARASYQLPYFWSSMRLSRRGDEIAYSCQRRVPGPREAVSQVRVRIGGPYQPAELGDRDHFLTARWVLFSRLGSPGRSSPGPSTGRGRCTARTRWVVDDGLVAAAGLPRPQEPPLVHYSPGVDVRIGRPESARR